MFLPLPLNEMAIKASVLDGLRDMGRTERRIPFQVRDGPGDLQDPAVGAGAQAQPVDGHFNELPRFLIERAGGADLAVGHAGVEQGVVSGEAIFLNIAGLFDPGLYGGGRLARFPCRQIAVADGGNLDMDVDPVEEGAGDPPLVLADLLG